MRLKYYMGQRLMAYFLLISLFLQSCNLFNPVTPREEAKDHQSRRNNSFILINQSPINEQEDKELIAQGGHKVTLYQSGEGMRATVEENLPEGFSKMHNSLHVYVDKSIDLTQVTKLDKKRQQQVVEVNFPNVGQPGDVRIWKRGLVGGMEKDGEEGWETVKRTRNKANTSSKRTDDSSGSKSKKESGTKPESITGSKGSKKSTSSKRTYDSNGSKSKKESGTKPESITGSKDSKQSTSSEEIKEVGGWKTVRRNKKGDKKFDKEEEVDESWEGKFISLTSKKSETAKFEPYSNEDYQYSDSEGEENGSRPGYPGVYNLTKKGIYNIEKDPTCNPVLIDGKCINNYINTNDSLKITSGSYKHTLEQDASSIFGEAKNKLNNKIIDLNQITILCVALRKVTGHVKKFVFTNQPSLYQFDNSNTYYTTEEIMRKISKIAHGKDYHVIMAQQAHAEGEFVQFLQERSTRYTHLVAMGCNRPHCLMCVEMMNGIFNTCWCHFSGSNKAPKQYGDNWYMPRALEKVLSRSGIINQILSKKIEINLLRRAKNEDELAIDNPNWKKKTETQQKHKLVPKKQDIVKMLKKGGNQKNKSSNSGFVIDFE